jgi:hypothetical protein
MTRYVDPPPKSPSRFDGNCGLAGVWPSPCNEPEMPM